jgi:uncharacterized membrane protein YkvI
MCEEHKNIFRVASIYAASVTGAGFASGQEIMQFFSAYETGGFWGILLAGVLFSAVGCIVLDKVRSERIRNYEEFIFPVFGWRIGWIIETAAILFIFCMYSIMTAGSGHLLAQMTGMPLRSAVFAMGVICTILIMTDIKGIAVFSTVLVPILLAGIILAGLYVIVMKDSPVFSISSNLLRYLSHVTENWVFSSLLYVGCNSILAVMMLCSVLPYLKTRRTALVSGILGGAALTLAALAVNTVIFLFNSSAAGREMPVINVLYSISASAGWIYSVLLWIAMLVSAVTSGFCFTERVAGLFRFDRRIAALMLCACSAPLSTVGFSRLISLLYPAFGCLGLFMVIVILITGLQKLVPHPERSEERRVEKRLPADPE